MSILRIVGPAILVAGCGSEPVFEINPDSMVTWSPDEIALTRYPAICGVTNPPFDDRDLYGLSVYDARGPEGTPQTAIHISFVRTDLEGKDYPIEMSPPSANEQTG